MAISLILLGIIIFLFGILTPVSDAITLPISIVFIGLGIRRLLMHKRKVN